MSEAFVFDALRTPRGRGKSSGSLHEVKPVRLLSSLEWSDRNKASLALFALSARRDPALLRALRGDALEALVDMAKWRTDGHAQPAFWLLGRNPRSVDFLIATEGEMKKVNWSTRREIVGSTLVVIGIALVISLFCWIWDFAFSAFFAWIRVLDMRS